MKPSFKRYEHRRKYNITNYHLMDDNQIIHHLIKKYKISEDESMNKLSDVYNEIKKAKQNEIVSSKRNIKRKVMEYH
jgi:midasin (ATPase involved in ribosome maturation)